jgi:hypothetical protein
MSVFVVETYVVKSEKRDDFTPALNEFLEFKKTHKELFKGLKSWKLYKQEYGAISGMYIEMWEYENMLEMETISSRIFSDNGMKKISKGFHKLVEPATFSASIWSSVA